MEGYPAIVLDPETLKVPGQTGLVPLFLFYPSLRPWTRTGLSGRRRRACFPNLRLGPLLTPQLGQSIFQLCDSSF